MKYWLILFAFIFTTPAFTTGSDENIIGLDGEVGPCVLKLAPLDWREHIPAIERLLRSAKESQIKISMPIHQYLNIIGRKSEVKPHVSYIEFENGLRAIWKTRSAFTEVAAFRAIYYMLGLRNAAPAVPKTFGGVDGALIYFTPSAFDLTKMNWQERQEIFAKVPAKAMSDFYVVQFMLGQSDRHFGNIAVDERYHLTSLDNEAIGHLTQFNTKTGGVPYVKRALLKPEYQDREDEFYNRPFPFENVRYLNVANPAIADGFLRNTNMTRERWDFLAKPFLNKNHPEERMMPIILWRNMFWTPVRANSLPPFKFDVLSVATLQKLRAINFEKMLEFFPEPTSPTGPGFSRLHRQLILERRDYILEQSKTAYLID